MIIGDFHFVRPVMVPNKTDSELVIDANAVLAFAVTLQRFEPVAGRNPPVIQGRSAVQHQELSQRRLPEVGWRNPPASASYPETAGFGISKAADHIADSNTQRY
jgi:hypothetical protein